MRAVARRNASPCSPRAAAASGFQSSGSSRAAMARTASSNSAICASKTSRNRPEMRKRHVDARMVELGDRQDLEAADARRALIPHGPRAHEQKRQRKILAAGAHGGAAPEIDHQRARPVAMVLEVAAEQFLGGLLGEHDARSASARRADRWRRDCGPVGSTSARPRVGAPDGPGATNLPSSAASSASRSRRRPDRSARRASPRVLAGWTAPARRGTLRGGADRARGHKRAARP